MAIYLAKEIQLLFRRFPILVVKICDVFGIEVIELPNLSHFLKVYPTPEPTFWSDGGFNDGFYDGYSTNSAELLRYKTQKWFLFFIQAFRLLLVSSGFYPLRFLKQLLKMADNIHRALQDIDLGVEDEPVQLPPEILNQAAAENRFVIIGSPVMPRRQNLRSIVAVMPRIWGQAGIVHGRIIEGRRFQFVFPTEEEMELVLRRGPWSFADRMLIIQRWYPAMNPPLLRFIPFWIQIRGIPFQFLNEEVIIHIGRSIGQYMEVDYNQEAAVRMAYVRVRINWNVDEPLRFRRNFQFIPGVNTILRFTYERLRGFCEECGLMTHDSGACFLQHGRPGVNHVDDESSDDDDNGENQFQILRRQPAVDEDHNEDANEAYSPRNAEQGNAVDDELYDDEVADARLGMWAGEWDSNDILDPVAAEDRNRERLLAMHPVVEPTNVEVSNQGSQVRHGEFDGDDKLSGRKRKGIEDRDNVEVCNKEQRTGSKFEVGEGSGHIDEDSMTVMDRGAVGPEPPLPP